MHAVPAVKRLRRATQVNLPPAAALLTRRQQRRFRQQMHSGGGSCSRRCGTILAPARAPSQMTRQQKTKKAAALGLSPTIQYRIVPNSRPWPTCRQGERDG